MAIERRSDLGNRGRIRLGMGRQTLTFLIPLKAKDSAT
jgi:hypothetical protein